jgi:sulfite exporter TauE/SafE
MFPRNTAAGPPSGSETSWRNAPQNTVIIAVFCGVLLLCLGLLLGATWTIQVLQPKLRWQAEERRRLNAEWLAVRTAREQWDTCVRCAGPLSEYDPTDDDD